MVQIIKAPQYKKKSQQFAEAFGKLGTGASQMYGEHLEKKAEDEAFKRMGLDLEGLSPEMKKIAFAEKMREQRERELQKYQLGQREENQAANQLIEDQRIEAIGKYFGPEAAEIYSAAPEGGKTALLQNLIENAQRGQNFPAQLQQAYQQPQEGEESGLTPKERIARGKERYATNLPLYQKAQETLKGSENEAVSLDILSELSPQISSGTRWNTNPFTGEILIPALASPEAQQFAKTVNDFTTKARESFGARISNFELDRFMKRLPTLANSEEGREAILKQMKILNNIKKAKEEALIDYVDDRGGARNVDWDVAERVATKMAQPRIKQLKEDLNKWVSKSEREYKDLIKEDKKVAKDTGKVLMEYEGQQYYIDPQNVKKAIEKGFNKL